MSQTLEAAVDAASRALSWRIIHPTLHPLEVFQTWRYDMMIWYDLRTRYELRGGLARSFVNRLIWWRTLLSCLLSITTYHHPNKWLTNGLDIFHCFTSEALKSILLNVWQLIFQGKVVVRPIAFRPSPGRPGSSAGPSCGQVSRPASSTLTTSPGLSSGYQTPVQTTFGPGGSVITTSTSSSTSSHPAQAAGFVPGHPLVKDGHRPFGSNHLSIKMMSGILTGNLL